MLSVRPAALSKQTTPCLNRNLSQADARARLPLMGASCGGAGIQLGLEPKKKRACASGRVEGKKRTFLIRGKSVLTPWSKKYMGPEILPVRGK